MPVSLHIFCRNSCLVYERTYEWCENCSIFTISPYNYWYGTAFTDKTEFNILWQKKKCIESLYNFESSEMSHYKAMRILKKKQKSQYMPFFDWNYCPP